MLRENQTAFTVLLLCNASIKHQNGVQNYFVLAASRFCTLIHQPGMSFRPKYFPSIPPSFEFIYITWYGVSLLEGYCHSCASVDLAELL